MPDLYPDDVGDAGFAPYLLGKKPLSTNIGGIQRSGATPLPVGFSPDDPEDNPLDPALDPLAFRPTPGSAQKSAFQYTDPTSASGQILQGNSPSGRFKSLGEVADASGSSAAQLAAKQPPPGTYTPPPASMPPPGSAPTGESSVNLAPQMRQMQTGQAGPAPSPQTQTLLDQARQISSNPPQMIGERPQDRTPVIDPATGQPKLDANGQPITKEKLGAKVASWAQRLGLAALAATKLAPYAQQIVHPEYTQQVVQQQAALKNIDTQIGLQEKADTAGYYNELRAGQAQKNIEQAAVAQEKAQPHYGQVQIDPANAKTYFPLHVPEADGSVWVDRAEALEREKEAGKPLILKEGEQLLDPNTYKPLATVPPKPAAIKEGETPLGPDRVAQMNQMLTSRYQILHSGQPLPPQYALQQGALRNDYNDIDKALEAEERAQANQTQLAIANEMRKQTQALAQNSNNFRDATELVKPHEKAFDDANTQLEKINDAEQMVKGGAIDQAIGVPKVMTALVTGAGSGVRITQAELNAIGGARGIAGDVEGTVRGWLGKGKLTPAQQQQLGAVLEGVKQRVIQKRQIANDAILGIRGAGDTPSMIAADNSARKRILDLEAVQQAGNTIALKSGKTATFPDQASAAAFKKQHPDLVK